MSPQIQAAYGFLGALEADDLGHLEEAESGQLHFRLPCQASGRPLGPLLLIFLRRPPVERGRHSQRQSRQPIHGLQQHAQSGPSLLQGCASHVSTQHAFANTQNMHVPSLQHRTRLESDICLTRPSSLLYLSRVSPRHSDTSTLMQANRYGGALRGQTFM